MTFQPLRFIALILAVFPAAAAAEPVTLKLSFFSSNRSPAYLSAVKPFVDAINGASDRPLKIDVYFSGRLSPELSRQPQLVRDGTADIAFIVPGYSPNLFPDSAAVELPGLFRDTREGTLVYTRLVAAHALRGYDDYVVIGAFATQPETIHSRKRTVSLADLEGQKLRVNNLTSAAAMTQLGVLPTLLPLNETSSAISSGIVDGAVVQAAQLSDAGIGRLVTNHYLLGVGAAPLALVMNRKVFDNLPAPAKALIQKYSGEWAASRYIETSDAISDRVIAQLKADPRRTVTVPTAADQATARRRFDAVTEKWAATSAHNRDLLQRVTGEIAKIRSGQ